MANYTLTGGEMSRTWVDLETHIQTLTILGLSCIYTRRPES